MRRTLVFALPVVLALGMCAHPAAGQQLYWLDTNFSNPALHRANADGSQATTVALAPGSLPEGLALDAASGRLYWGEAAWTNARVMTAPPTLASPTALVTGLSCVRGVAVASGNGIYFTSSNLNAGGLVQRAPLAGGSPVTLLNSGPAANPRGIALDVAGNRLYFADFDQGRIVSTLLDGSSPVTLVSTGAGSGPYGIALDPVAQQLYWTEFGTGLLRRCKTDGTLLASVYSGLTNPTYLALDRIAGMLYWIDAGAGGQRIRKAPVGGGAVTNFALPVSSYGGIVFAPVGTLEAPTSATSNAFGLAPVWPNPARGDATIEYALPHAARVRIAVSDVQGRVVATLRDGVETAGAHRLDWRAARPRGPLPAGLYFVTMRAEGRDWTRRVAITQ